MLQNSAIIRIYICFIGVFLVLTSCQAPNMPPTPVTITSNPLEAQDPTAAIFPPTDVPWEPPQPQGRIDGPTVHPQLPAPAIYYEQVGFPPDRQTTRLSIQSDGQLYFWTNSQTIGATDKISSERVTALMHKLEVFSAEQEPTPQIDPFGPTIDGPFRKIGYFTDEETILILRGSNLLPELLEIESILQDLHTKLAGQVSTAPDIAIIYHYESISRTVSFEIDRNGSIYNDQKIIGRISEEEIDQLILLFENNSFQNLDDYYTPQGWLDDPDAPDKITETRVIVNYVDNIRTKRVVALSGAKIPLTLQNILQNLTDIYNRFSKSN